MPYILVANKDWEWYNQKEKSELTEQSKQKFL